MGHRKRAEPSCTTDTTGDAASHTADAATQQSTCDEGTAAKAKQPSRTTREGSEPGSAGGGTDHSSISVKLRLYFRLTVGMQPVSFYWKSCADRAGLIVPRLLQLEWRGMGADRQNNQPPFFPLASEFLAERWGRLQREESL